MRKHREKVDLCDEHQLAPARGYGIVAVRGGSKPTPRSRPCVPGAPSYTGP
jgi:hypothetical protein